MARWIPLFTYQRLGSLHVRSNTRTSFAPADRQSSARATTTSGSVLAACSGVRSHPIFGLRTTTSPRDRIVLPPPSASTALRTLPAALAPDAPAPCALFPAAAASRRREPKPPESRLLPPAISPLPHATAVPAGVPKHFRNCLRSIPQRLITPPEIHHSNIEFYHFLFLYLK